MFQRKRQLTHRRILVTGASSGIGKSLAEELANLDAQLLLTARREDRLETITSELGHRTSGRVISLPGDITNAGHRESLVATAKREFGGLDILINNAGVGGIGTFVSADEDRLRLIMEVNFFAPIELIRCAVPLLRESSDGVIVNMGSVLGHCAVPKKSEYCASKFAMHGITDALRMELLGDGIDLLLVSPSTTQSEFFDHALRSTGKVAINRRAMSPKSVARSTIRAMEVRRRETILSIGGKSLVYANRFLPGFMSKLLRRFG